MLTNLTVMACAALMGAGADAVATARNGAAGAAAAAVMQEDDRVLRVYDLREFGALLPGTREYRPALGQATSSSVERGGVPGPFEGEKPGAAPATPVDSLVYQLCSSLSIVGERIAEGVYLVSGEREGQERFSQLIENVREVYTSTSVVEITAIATPTPGAPPPGAAYTPGATDRVLRRISASVPRRVESRLDNVDSTTFVADWTPVVADHSVGYDPLTANVREGLSVLVTPGAEGGAGVPLRIAGAISATSLVVYSTPLMGSSPEGSLTLGLPLVQSRDIAVMTVIPAGKATIVATATGFDDDETILIVATVK